MRYELWTGGIVLGLLMAACAGSQSTSPEDVWRDATVQYLDFEGGFYGLVADTSRYDPINLDEAYQEDGLRVRCRLRVRDDLMSIHQWGQLVEILEIERVEEDSSEAGASP